MRQHGGQIARTWPSLARGRRLLPSVPAAWPVAGPRSPGPLLAPGRLGRVVVDCHGTKPGFRATGRQPGPVKGRSEARNERGVSSNPGSKHRPGGLGGLKPAFCPVGHNDAIASRETPHGPPPLEIRTQVSAVPSSPRDASTANSIARRDRSPEPSRFGRQAFGRQAFGNLACLISWGDEGWSTWSGPIRFSGYRQPIAVLLSLRYDDPASAAAVAAAKAKQRRPGPPPPTHRRCGFSPAREGSSGTPRPTDIGAPGGWCRTMPSGGLALCLRRRRKQERCARRFNGHGVRPPTASWLGRGATSGG